MKYIILLACLQVVVACGDDDLPDAGPADAGRDGGPGDGGPGDVGSDANDLVDAFLPDTSTADTGSDAGDADLDVGFDTPDAATSPVALRFDGDSQVLVENIPFDDRAEFTVEVWARYRGDITSINTIASNRESAGPSGFLLGYYLGAPLVQVFGTNLVGTSGSVSRFIWHHIAVVRDTSNLLTIYVDGVASGSGTRAGSIATTAMLHIGSDAHTDTDLDGDLHDLRLWNVARTPEEIRSSLDLSMPLDDTGLLANWPMSEGSGQTVSDTAGEHPGVLGETPAVESRDPEWIMWE